LSTVFCAVETAADEGGEETAVTKVVKKTTKTTVVSATEGRSCYYLLDVCIAH